MTWVSNSGPKKCGKNLVTVSVGSWHNSCIRVYKCFCIFRQQFLSTLFSAPLYWVQMISWLQFLISVLQTFYNHVSPFTSYWGLFDRLKTDQKLFWPPGGVMTGNAVIMRFGDPASVSVVCWRLLFISFHSKVILLLLLAWKCHCGGKSWHLKCIHLSTKPEKSTSLYQTTSFDPL